MSSLMRCGECGIEFSVPDHFYAERKNTGKGWYCPNGHPRVFKESETEKLRRERDRLAQQLAERDDAIAAKEREIKRIKKRSSAGTCPCCNRTFSNMARHMKHMHPSFAAENTTNVVPIKKKRA